MSLSSALLRVQERESGGENAQRGFEYQACCVVSHLLELEAKKDEYLILPEYHDDILIANSESNPTSLKFIQVKTKKRANWTEAKLITVERGDLSILGKLYLNKKNFNEYNVELVFLTNSGFSFSNEDSFSLSSVNKINKKDKTTSKDKIIDAIKKQLNIESIDTDCLSFLSYDLSLDDSTIHLMGKVESFMKEHIDENSKFSSKSITESLIIEVNKKSKKITPPRDFKELIEKKGIKSSYIRDFFNALREKKPDFISWERASNLLRDIYTSECSSIKLMFLEVTYRSVIDEIKNDSSIHYEYLSSANKLFNKDLLESDFNGYIKKTIQDINNLNVNFEFLEVDEQNCILVYSILSNIGK